MSHLPRCGSILLYRRTDRLDPAIATYAAEAQFEITVVVAHVKQDKACSQWTGIGLAAFYGLAAFCGPAPCCLRHIAVHSPLLQVTWSKPNILLLDEPSNHLDMDAVDALIEGLTLFKGGVLMVSHDQYLIEATVDELWCCEDGCVRPFHGTFTEYRARLRAKAAGG